MGEMQRFFVVHLRKTAGTSLRNRFVHAFGSDAVYPNGSEGTMIALINMPFLLERWPERRHEIRAIIGHFPLCATEMLDAPFTTVTVLRDPVERTLSFLRFQRVRVPADEQRTLEEIYDQQPRFDTHIHNHMTRMYGLELDEALAGDGGLTVVDQTPELLARAKDGLARIDEIGFHDDFDAFCAGLAIRHDIDLGGDVVSNISPVEQASDALVERIRRDHALDLELYEFARELVASRA